MRFPKNKYRAQKATREGYSFDSKGEAALFDILWLRQKTGEITELQPQAQVYLTKAKILYKPDFSYMEDGKQVYAEFKGVETQAWRIKRRLWWHYGPGLLHIWKGNWKRPFLQETIQPANHTDPCNFP